MVNGRNKGANFEREIAQLLFQELGIKFARDLRQYQQAEYGDLITDDPAWPYLLELKRYSDGPIGGPNTWWQQACAAADKAHKQPVVIYRYDRQPIRCVLMLQGVRADVNFDDFCYLARERMAHDSMF
jgi:Holliday junction resolvase